MDVSIIVGITIAALFVNFILLFLTASIIPAIYTKRLSDCDKLPITKFGPIVYKNNKPFVKVEHELFKEYYLDVDPWSLLLPFFLRIDKEILNDGLLEWFTTEYPIAVDGDGFYTTTKEQILENHHICYSGWQEEKFKKEISQVYKDSYLASLNKKSCR